MAILVTDDFELLCFAPRCDWRGAASRRSRYLLVQWLLLNDGLYTAHLLLKSCRCVVRLEPKVLRFAFPRPLAAGNFPFPPVILVTFVAS